MKRVRMPADGSDRRRGAGTPAHRRTATGGPARRRGMDWAVAALTVGVMLVLFGFVLALAWSGGLAP